MRPCFYADIRIRNGATVGKGGIGSLPVATRLLSVLHGIFRSHPGRFALGFPLMTEGEFRHPGHVFRVFFESEDEWREILWKELNQNERIGAFVFLPETPKKVPVSFSGPWIEYSRFRVPTRKSCSPRGEAPMGWTPSSLREKRSERAEQFPFFRLHSKSTGERFSLHVARREGHPTSECFPDSFGLSRGQNSFALPMEP